MNQFGFESLRDSKKEPQAKVLNWAPRIFEFDDFLSKKECDHLIKVAEPILAPSQTYGGVVSSVRTSYGVFLRGETNDRITDAIAERIALLTYFPVSHGESFNVIRYEVGQQYKPHHDYHHRPDSVTGGQRIASFLMYLNEPEEGGSTDFPLLKLSVKPVKGKALLFFNTKLDEKTTDDKTLHAGTPIIKGCKWLATKWLHNLPVNESAHKDQYKK